MFAGDRMKHRTAITVAGIAAVAAGTGAVLGLTIGPGGAAGAATRTAASSPARVVVDCGAKPAEKPASTTITCADGGTGIEHMHWTSWTAQLASGYGTFYQNDCVPYCAAGKIISYPVLATFWGSAAVKGYPADRRYTELTVIFTGQRPPVYV